MSKLYNQYCKLKEQDSSKIYILKSGIFYLLIAEDAEIYGGKLGLKVTKLNDEVNKCGFPISSYEKYKLMLDSFNCNYEFVEEQIQQQNNHMEILHYLKNLDINSLTPLKALEILNELKEKIIDE